MQIVLARGVIGKADEFRIALLSDMNVVKGIGAAHVERARRALSAHHAEAREEFLHAIEVGRQQPPIGNVGRFDVGHASPRLPCLCTILARFGPKLSGGPRRMPPLRSCCALLGEKPDAMLRKNLQSNRLPQEFQGGSSWKRENTR